MRHDYRLAKACSQIKKAYTLTHTLSPVGVVSLVCLSLTAPRVTKSNNVMGLYKSTRNISQKNITIDIL